MAIRITIKGEKHKPYVSYKYKLRIRNFKLIVVVTAYVQDHPPYEFDVSIFKFIFKPEICRREIFVEILYQDSKEEIDRYMIQKIDRTINHLSEIKKKILKEEGEYANSRIPT